MTTQETLQAKKDFYSEKQESRRDRLEVGQAKAEERSTQYMEKARRLGDMIPFGQPILVGHHSEKRARRDAETIHNSVGRAIEEDKKASHYSNSLEAMDNNRAISSDDPEAVTKLKSKLEGLEAKREEYKAHNKKAKKEGYEKLQPFYLQNLGANIRTVKKRIESLEKAESKEYTDIDIHYGDNEVLEVKYNTLQNRVQLIFDGKPSDEIRSELKRNGFRWSPYNSAWQRQLNNAGLYAGQRVVNFLKSI